MPNREGVLAQMNDAAERLRLAGLACHIDEQGRDIHLVADEQVSVSTQAVVDGQSQPGPDVDIPRLRLIFQPSSGGGDLIAHWVMFYVSPEGPVSGSFDSLDDALSFVQLA